MRNSSRGRPRSARRAVSPCTTLASGDGSEGFGRAGGTPVSQPARGSGGGRVHDLLSSIDRSRTLTSPRVALRLFSVDLETRHVRSESNPQDPSTAGDSFPLKYPERRSRSLP